MDTFLAKHGLKGKLSTIFLDETPTKYEDVRIIGQLQDILKMVPGVVLILSGTHARATNMIGLTQGSVSSSELCRLEPWAITVTKLPRFSLAHSRLDRSSQNIKRNINTYADTTVRHAVTLIQASMENGVNPRLICFAVAAMINALANFSFYCWQTKFAGQLAESKFGLRVWWIGFACRATGSINGGIKK